MEDTRGYGTDVMTFYINLRCWKRSVKMLLYVVFCSCGSCFLLFFKSKAERPKMLEKVPGFLKEKGSGSQPLEPPHGKIIHHDLSLPSMIIWKYNSSEIMN